MKKFSRSSSSSQFSQDTQDNLPHFAQMREAHSQASKPRGGKGVGCGICVFARRGHSKFQSNNVSYVGLCVCVCVTSA